MAGPPLPPSACGAGHVHPHITHQDQLPQHQADSCCVTLCHSSAHHSTPEAASPSSTAFPCVLLATLTLGVQTEGEKSTFWTGRKGKLWKGGSEGPGFSAAVHLQTRGSRGASQDPQEEWLSHHQAFVHPASFVGSSLQDHLHLKKLRPGEGKFLAKPHSYSVPHSQHPRSAPCFPSPTKDEGDKN